MSVKIKNSLKFLALGILTCATWALAGCQSAPPKPNELLGRPSWVALGPDVIHEGEVDAVASKQLLSFGARPQWFDSKDYSKSKPIPNNTFMRGNKPQPQLLTYPILFPYPMKLEEVPLVDRGVRLAVEAHADQPPNLAITLKLSSEDKNVVRELMHRHSNALPFLFSIYVDQNAVAAPPPQNPPPIYGDELWLDTLVRSGQTRIWNVKVDSASLEQFLPDAKPHRIALVVAFSSRQHYEVSVQEAGWDLNLFDQIEPEAPGAIGGPRSQVLVRSNVIYLDWTGTGWVVPKQAP